MVGIHETLALRDDAVAVDVRIVSEGDVEIVFQSDQTFHGIGGGAVHPDLAVPVDGHEGEGRIDDPVHHLEGESVAVGDGIPEVHRRPAERIDADFEPCFGNRFHVDDILQILHIGRHIVIFINEPRFKRLLNGDPSNVSGPLL